MTIKTITLINGSLGGTQGNTYSVAQSLLNLLRASGQVRIEEIHLATEIRPLEELGSVLDRSDGFVFTTGTYWDSWGSPLQSFLEKGTRFEGTRAWLGKPAAVIVTMHSVGGKSVLSRLQGVLCTLGLSLPPMSGMTYSLISQVATSLAGPAFSGHGADIWQLDDLATIGSNLLEAVHANSGRNWVSWEVDTKDPTRRWLEAGVAAVAEETS